MMLPEHVTMLRELEKKKSYQAKPMIDEQRLEELNHLISDYIQTNESVIVTYYSKGTYNTIVGRIKKIDPFEKELYILNQDNSLQKIKERMVMDIRQNPL